MLFCGIQVSQTKFNEQRLKNINLFKNPTGHREAFLKNVILSDKTSTLLSGTTFTTSVTISE